MTMQSLVDVTKLEFGPGDNAYQLSGGELVRVKNHTVTPNVNINIASAYPDHWLVYSNSPHEAGPRDFIKVPKGEWLALQAIVEGAVQEMAAAERNPTK